MHFEESWWTKTCWYWSCLYFERYSRIDCKSIVSTNWQNPSYLKMMRLIFSQRLCHGCSINCSGFQSFRLSMLQHRSDFKTDESFLLNDKIIGILRCCGPPWPHHHVSIDEGVYFTSKLTVTLSQKLLLNISVLNPNLTLLIYLRSNMDRNLGCWKTELSDKKIPPTKCYIYIFMRMK